MRGACAVAILAVLGNPCDLPDAVATPGVASPLVTQENIQETICAPGYAKSKRPLESYTARLKREQLDSGVYASYLGAAAFEEDHLISIENGGDPWDERNLWPQHWKEPWGARTKDRLESVIHKLICGGAISLQEGQQALAKDWKDSYRRYVP